MLRSLECKKLSELRTVGAGTCQCRICLCRVCWLLTGLELRKPELTRSCEMELPEQLRDFPPSPRPEQFRDFSPSEKPLDCRDLLPSYRSVMLISSKPEIKSKNWIFRCCPALRWMRLLHYDADPDQAFLLWFSDQDPASKMMRVRIRIRNTGVNSKRRNLSQKPISFDVWTRIRLY